MNICIEWEGLDINVEDHSACVHCGELWERHYDRVVPGEPTIHFSEYRLPIEEAYIMTVRDHPEATVRITPLPEKRVKFP